MVITTEKTIILIQKQTGHEPDTWEDFVIHKEHSKYNLEGMATIIRIKHGEGHYRLFDRRGEIHDIQVFLTKKFVVSINNELCEAAGD